MKSTVTNGSGGQCPFTDNNFLIPSDQELLSELERRQRRKRSAGLYHVELADLKAEVCRRGIVQEDR